MEAESPGGLAGVRVLEVAGSIAVAWAAKLFADLGADVIRAEGETDLVRERPFDVHRWLNTNKRSVRRGSAEQLRALAIDADVVLHGLDNGSAVAAGLAYETLRDLAPDIVVCAITAWGNRGPYAAYRAEEITIIHGSSWGFLSPAGATQVELPPLKAPGHQAMINLSTSAAAVALAAHYRSRNSGFGEFIDFSLFAAGAKITEFAPVKATFLGKDATRLGTKSVIPWGIYQCQDGLIQLLCVEEEQWRAFRSVMGDPDWAQLEIFDTAPGRRENADLIDHYLEEWFSTQKVEEVCDAAQQLGVCLSPVYTMPQLAQDPHLNARGFFATTPDGLTLPGRLCKFDQPWWGLRRAAPEKWEHDGQGWLSRSRKNEAFDPEALAGPRRPLEGVRVCDFTWVWAGPYCTQQLAHLGADVIKIESPERPDFYRRSPLRPKGVVQTLDTSGVFQMYNTDKRSLAIDLNRPEARKVVLDLVRHCDVVVDNFSVGVMQHLGLGVADLRSVNPAVIIASLSGYGQSGPKARYKAYGPAAAALAGLDCANGYGPGDVKEPGLAIGDPATGLAAAWAIVSALVARQNHGTSAVLDVAMVEAVTATVGEIWMEYLAADTQPAPRANRDPQWAPCGCYPAAGTDRWVTIICTTEDEWQSLCSVVDPALAKDERFATRDARHENEDELDRLLAGWTQHRNRWHTSALLQAVGVASFPSLSPLDLWRGDPQLEALDMLESPLHPVTGAMTLPGVPWHLTNGPNGIRLAAPMLGQHSQEILADLIGYPIEKITALREAGVLPNET
ncbi:CoA transferase [Mycobacterium sp. E1747]|uniref:CaiB/BaiF CoA-transferase family protein n=1 Tax=Mycobacterium sp. E1747 TaxID=1834128 RepID=UPI0007FEF838|nr:CoA transferase [Mycobacterium sp. E1747]OBH08875.1 hypothetical protein A5695_25600 [Mycobacterium sp. E1747]